MAANDTTHADSRMDGGARGDVGGREGGITRRGFLQALGAGLVISVAGGRAIAQARPPRRGGGGFGGRSQAGPVSARVHIAKDGAITVMTGKVEGGQGARTEITQAAAEELKLPAAAISLIMADTSLCPDDGITAGSRTTPSTIPAVRQGCAAARDLLVGLAAAKWGIDRAAVTMSEGKALDKAGKRELSYADLAAGDEAEKLFNQAPPPGVALTPVRQWKVMGISHSRVNARDLVAGKHLFPSDIARPGMLHGKVLRAPSYGAKLTGLDDTAAKAIAGATVVRDGDFVGVAAPTAHAAALALKALDAGAKWSTAPHPSSTEVHDYLRKNARGAAKNPFAGEVAKAAKSLRQTYNVAYIQHASLEPRAAVAQWDGGKLTVWTGSQNPFGCKSGLERAFGLGGDKVRVIVPDFGSGFGGKHTPDADIEAARLAKAVGKPVSVRWTRAEEFTWAYFRPGAVIDIEASLDAQGKLTSWHFVTINPGSSGVNTPYRVGQVRCEAVSSNSPMRQGSYRALASTANNFARESFMDELAAAAGMDPLAFRLANLEDERLRPVLEKAAREFDWATRVKKKDPAVGVGLACGTEKGSVVAACVEVALDGDKISVREVCQVFECGKIINPDNCLAQVQGCIVMGLGPALREEMIFDKGVVSNASFLQYRVPRFADLPKLDIHLLDRPDSPSAGAGETPIMAVAPAIANAVFHATGKRIRRMPIRLDGGTRA
jgi:isoquinoline 1-oxidoreductase